MNKNLTKLLLTIIGAILFIAYIWYRFIRERMPKYIPFNLTEYGCMILLYICCIYLMIIVLLITEFNTKSDKLSIIIDYIYKPLKVLDESLKKQSHINYYHNKVIGFCITIKEIPYTSIYYGLNIFPRLVLVTVLCFDIFYFTKIGYLYKIILLGLFPLLYKYIIYSLKYAKEQYILRLESITNKIMTDYKKEPDGTDWSFLSVRDFIDIQTDAIFYYNHKYSINPIPTSSYLHLFSLDTKSEQMQVEHYRLLDIIIPLSVSLEEFDLRHNFNKKIKYIKIGIFGTYLICWSYILIISLPFLPADAFQWLWVIKELEDPFSLTNLLGP